MFWKFAFACLIVLILLFIVVGKSKANDVDFQKVGDVTPGISYACIDLQAAMRVVAAAVMSGEEVGKQILLEEAERRCFNLPFPISFVLKEKILSFVDFLKRPMVLWRMRMDVENSTADFYLWGIRYKRHYGEDLQQINGNGWAI